jgi:GxxExxY protein
VNISSFLQSKKEAKGTSVIFSEYFFLIFSNHFAFLMKLKSQFMKITKSFLKDLTYQFNAAAIEVHKTLGPGLLESIYHQSLIHELKLREINFESEHIIPVTYKGNILESNVRCDFLVEKCMVVEIKSIEEIAPVHEAQILTYMKLLKTPRGLLLNFNVRNLFHDGQKTFVNEYFTLLDE